MATQTNTPDFAAELACGFTGQDDLATAAWLHAALTAHPAYTRACAYWAAASEDQQASVASHLGWANGKAQGVPAAILLGFTIAQDLAAAALGY